MEKASRKKVGFFNKIGFKMVLIIALAGAVISAVTMLMIVPRSTKQIEILTKNEMTNLAQAYSTDLNDKLMEKRVLSYDGYANILRNVKIPITNLIIDEANSDTGLLTRIESFIDILEERRKNHDERENN